MSEKIPRPLQPVPDELLQAMEDYLRKAGLPEWIRDMQAYYRRTCNVRRSDITRLLGPPTGSSPSASISPPATTSASPNRNLKIPLPPKRHNAPVSAERS